MGKKSGGSQSSPPPVDQTTPPVDFTAMEAMMDAMLQMQNNMLMSQATEMPPLPQMPVINDSPDIDWTEKNRELAARSRADFDVDEARRKGRTDTILTSPLLDDEEAETTSLLVG